jgi:hypothetical protein
MTVIVKHNKTNSITDWTQAQLDEQIALGNFPSGTTLANIVLPSDWNNDHTLTGLGTMAEQDATAVAITGGTIDNTTIGATTATTGRFTSVTTPSVTATTTDLTLSAISTGAVKFNTAGGTQFQINNTASATAWGQITGSTVSSFAGTIEFSSASTVSGSDAISINYATQQIGNHAFKTGVSKLTQLNITGVASVVNYHNFVGSATTKAPIYSVAGSDTNISMAFQPKGTGAIDLAAGSSGVNISNGGTVTAVTRTNAGSAYTTLPSIAISAPTTAGGVQAVLATTLQITNLAIAVAGSGYAVGNTITLVGGTGTATTFTVATLSGSGVATLTTTNNGSYTVVPSNPVATTTNGAGTGCTINMTWGVTSPTITNAGSGYIEQPTITFSGGGGSGAAAYATVGSGTTLKTISSTLSLSTDGGEIFRINSGSRQNVNYLNAFGQVAGSPPSLSVAGTDSNITFDIFSKNTGAIRSRTGSGGAIQFQVTDTASAVNYVQVTGGATGGNPSITVQGSDGTRGLAFSAKGNANINFFNNNLSNNIFVISGNAGTIANYLQATASVAGTATSLQAQGSDTDIDLALTPKGTGLIRFGTYVAGATLATGYINIKAADGTTYKVLVST